MFPKTKSQQELTLTDTEELQVAPKQQAFFLR